jgi:uncharacterized protein (DUF488 family)
MSVTVNQPVYKRQRFLLAFVRQISGSVAHTDLQKLVFLHTMEGGSAFYDFVPYKYGAYSFQLAEDVDILRRDGYLSVENSRIKVIGEYHDEALFKIAKARGDNLIRKAYCEYQYYAMNSEIVERIFGGKDVECFRKEKETYTQTTQVLFTIGYEGRSVEAFVNTLIQNDIRLLCDVRKNPISRKFGFSIGKLGHIMENVKIKYVHIPDLGIESDKRCSLNAPEDYKRLFDDYKKTLPRRKVCLEEVYTLLRTNTRIALMCFERSPEMCHRHVIRDYIVDTYRVRSIDIDV